MGRAGIRRRKPRRRLPKVGRARTPPLPPEMTPTYVYDPRLGGQFLLGPAAFGRALEHGTKAQKRWAWSLVAVACAMFLAAMAVVILSNL